MEKAQTKKRMDEQRQALFEEVNGNSDKIKEILLSFIRMRNNQN